ncbi:MAG: beta-lactamase family protein, partial [Rivularia sp. ALOHA_DT_140]|nr:beta-lactamase family protein [Rivularia sp. ALOHA_DT_140]
HHTHTVEQLMRHRSGIRHYRGSKRKNCEVPNNSAWKDSSNTQYSTATKAATLFQDNPLMFSPDSKRCYTTHGYTVLGAALEGATKKSFSGLIRREINQRLNIPTLKPEFRNQSNPERAKIYSLSNGKSVPAKRDNLSWKYPGGGLESSATDLTRLGMKVLDGSFVSKKSLNTYSTNNKLSHSGSQKGAKSYWRINRSDKTVISILTNQSSGKPEELTKTIEGILQKN